MSQHVHAWQPNGTAEVSEPTTAAGQRLADRLAEPDDYEWGNRIRADILDIEAEAAAQAEGSLDVERAYRRGFTAGRQGSMSMPTKDTVDLAGTRLTRFEAEVAVFCIQLAQADPEASFEDGRTAAAAERAASKLARLAAEEHS